MKLNNIIRTILLLISISHIANCFSQNWPKIYGDDFQAYGEEILESYDMGYFICGSILKNAETFEYGWLIKTDINGNILWDKKFGESSYENYFSDFDKTSDNGLIISGSTAQQDVEQDPLFIKLNACGEIEWCQILLRDGFNTSSGIVSLPEGDYLGMIQYFGGQTQLNRISLVKMDSSGEPIWIKHLAQEDSTTFNEEGNKLYLTPDSNIIVCGRTQGGGMKPFWIKADTAGEEQWELKWQGGWGNANNMVFASSGMYYSSAFFTLPGQHNLPTIFKFKDDGTPIDQFQLMGDTVEGGGAGPMHFYIDSTIATVLGWTDDPLGFDGYTDIWITDTLGNLFNRRQLLAEPLLQAQSEITFDNKILVSSHVYIDGNWDIYLWKMNADLEDDSIYTQPITYDSLCPHQILSDTVDLDCSLFVNIDEIPTKEEYESTIKISPNHARDWISLTLPDNVSSGNIELTIYNIFGQEVMNTTVAPQNRTVSLNVSNFACGLYLAVCQDAKKKIFKGKFVDTR
jgi:hypothetical protein